MALNVTRLFPLPNWPPVYTEEQEISMGGAGSSSSITGGGLQNNFGNITNKNYVQIQSVQKEDKHHEDEEEENLEEKIKKQLDLL